ncbi:hypothetical protein P3S67_004727 [Capsicum chacoense]
MFYATSKEVGIWNLLEEICSMRFRMLMPSYSRKWVLHDLMDEDCVKILKKCKESIPSREKGGKVIIIDILLEVPKQSNEFVRAQHNMDMLMMVLYAAKERTEKECEKLFTEAGFYEFGCRLEGDEEINGGGVRRR